MRWPGPAPFPASLSRISVSACERQRVRSGQSDIYEPSSLFGVVALAATGSPYPLCELTHSEIGKATLHPFAG